MSAVLLSLDDPWASSHPKTKTVNHIQSQRWDHPSYTYCKLLVTFPCKTVNYLTFHVSFSSSILLPTHTPNRCLSVFSCKLYLLRCERCHTIVVSEQFTAVDTRETTLFRYWRKCAASNGCFPLARAGWHANDNYLFVGCLTSQQHTSVSQGRICSDIFTCCPTETEVADQTFHLTQSQYTDTRPTSPSTDPIPPGTWQCSHWSAHF